MQDNSYKKEKVPTSLTILKDANSSDHQALFSSYAMNKYSLTFEGLKIKYQDVEAVIKKIMEVDTDIKRMDFPINIFYDFYVLESEDNMLTFDSFDNKKKVQINYYFHTYEQCKIIFDIIQSFQDKDDELFVSISSFFYDANKNIKATESLKVKKDFAYNSPDYYPYLDTQEMFRQYMMSDSNILLLTGLPGVGKSKLGDAFMQYLLETTDIDLGERKSKYEEEVGDTLIEIDIITEESEGIKVAYIKNEDILSEDIFWNILKEDEYHLVFLDDLDYALLPRTQQIATGEDVKKNKFISNLLSFTDGIFESGNKTKFIITTNKETKDIDTAVLRKGRTFDILQLRELHNTEAKKIWLENELPEEDFKTEMGEDSILQADLGSTIKMKIKAREKDIELKAYISEEGISLYNKVKNPKKLGL